MNREPGTVVPSIISVEAMETAAIIDRELTKFLARKGIAKVAGGQLVKVIAKMIQLAINRSFEKSECASSSLVQ